MAAEAPQSRPAAPSDLQASFGSADPEAETLLRMDSAAPASTRSSENRDSPEIAIDEPLDVSDHDEQLAALVIERGFALQEEVDSCVRRTRKLLGLGPRKPLSDVLVNERAITPNQLARLEAVIESNRTARTIPGFRMLASIGKGTSASVYKARQVNLDRLVAIKVLPRKALASPRLVEAFYAEGRAAAQLNHPSIVQAYDVGRCGDFHYFVMEFVEGRTLYELLTADGGGPLDQERALEIVIQVAEGLAHAHARGLVHRDVKPKNIILLGHDGTGQAKLADMGLARWIADREVAQREQGRTMGTPYYISPEQVRGDFEIGPATDIYSLGATWYHMLTGVPPFTGATSREVMDKHLQEAPVPACERNPAVHPGVSEIVDHMLVKAPEGRYRSCDALLDELRAWRTVYLLARGEEAKQATRQR
jgi:serine/threonine-protein kinase